MKKKFGYRNGEIIVTWNERNMLNDYEYDQYYAEVKNTTIAIKSSFTIGVELKVHRGGRICYGFLVAQVNPHNESNCVKISIMFTHNNVVKYENSSLLDDTFVYKGLPKEYVKQISESMTETIMNEKNYPQCEIKIEYAANCEVGSSPIIFGVIAEMLVKLICSSSIEELSNMDIETFTTKYVRKINLQY